MKIEIDNLRNGRSESFNARVLPGNENDPEVIDIIDRWRARAAWGGHVIRVRSDSTGTYYDVLIRGND